MASGVRISFDWWNEVNRSLVWQDRIFHTLAGLFGFVAALVLACAVSTDGLRPSFFTINAVVYDIQLLQKEEFSIPDHLMIHDWAFTDSHYIIFGNRIKLDVLGSMLAVSGLSPMFSALSVNPSRPTSPIYLLPRFSEEASSHLDKWRVPIEVPSQLWLLHVANSFEQKDDKGNLEIQIYAAACSYQWFNYQKMFGYDWKTGKLDPSFMNAREGEESTLPHLVRPYYMVLCSDLLAL